MKLSSLASGAVLAMAALAPMAASAADDYPAQQAIRMIVPYAPGGASDVLARLLASSADKELGQRIVVENRAGGASVVGTGLVASAEPNGYTIGLVDSAFLINPALMKDKLPYDAEKDFRPVILVATAPVVLTVNEAVKANSVAELVALAKAEPGKLNFSSAGNGTALHLAGEVFKLATDTDIVHIPYKGGAPSVMAVVAGETQVNFSAPSTVAPHIAAGKLRPLAVTGSERLATLPDVPTFAEAGVPDVDALISFGVVAPAGVPDNVVQKLVAAFGNALESDSVREKIKGLGFGSAGGASDDYANYVQREIARWKAVVRDANVKVD